MKNRSIIALTLIAIISFSTMHISAYSSKTSKPTFQNRQPSTTINGKRRAKKPEYYQGHSYGLQNYPGKTIDPGMNTGMLPTNSASHSGNDISF